MTDRTDRKVKGGKNFRIYFFIQAISTEYIKCMFKIFRFLKFLFKNIQKRAPLTLQHRKRVPNGLD